MRIKDLLDRISRIAKDPERIGDKLELLRIQSIPRYTEFQTKILNHPIKGVDSASFVFMFDEIFKKEIYKFFSDSDEPFIIDCGANIGLSVIYFKKIHPKSKILAFEPDASVFSALSANIYNFNLSDVELVNKAVWNSETTLEFMSEGADGGRIVKNDRENSHKYSVQTVRLKDLLVQPIDLLKIDIEGAETVVIQDCKENLKYVKNIFIEYHSFEESCQTFHLVINALVESGFRIHLHPSFSSPHPFVERLTALGMDMQVNIFAFRDKV